MNVIDLFSGVGGLSYGLINAGFNIVLANEIDKEIANSYCKNHPHTLMINSDISNFINEYEKIIKQNKSIKDIDLVVGGPPCQGFSMAGARIRNNGFTKDARNYLFRQYFEVIKRVNPKYFIMENVVGLASMENGEILSEIKRIFSDSNNFKNGSYYIQTKIFECDELGVPQKRKRLIIIGSKKKFNLKNVISSVLKASNNNKFNQKNTIRDAIYDLWCSGHNNHTSTLQQEMKQNSSKIYNHDETKHSKLAINRMNRIKPGGNWESLTEKNLLNLCIVELMEEWNGKIVL